MAAVCAGCMQPIVTGDNFALSGTEVFHRSCLAREGSVESIGNRQRRQLASLEQRHLQVQNTLTRHADTVAEKDRIIAQRNQRVSVLTQQLEDANATRDILASTNNALRGERDRLVKEVELARQEVALAHLPPAQSKIAPDPRDDAEIRFSMLEIDGKD